MVGKAASKNDWAWLGLVYQHASSIMATLGGLVWVGGVVLAKPIILLWAGESGYAGMLTVFALGGYGYILSTVNLTANYLSGLNATRTMLWIGWAEAIANLLLSIAFLHLWGIGGVALGTFLSAFLTVYWLLPQDISRQTQMKLKIDWKPIGKHFFFVVLPTLIGGCLISFYTEGLYSFIAGLILCLIYLILSWKISTDLTQKFIIQALSLRLVSLFKRAI
jgi:O-antigen/teichoic acid export membrane protein